ncbi:MAG: transposase [Geobacter sp.]|nr:transposase [Geobacter sp.]
MPRIARGLADGHFYHIINRGNGRQEVFHKPEDYAAFVGLLHESADRFTVGVYAWCLMPNHFHLLVQPEQAECLSAWMQWLMTSHVRRYHRHYRTSGHVWQGRYKSFIIQDDTHLITVARYIEGNPVRSGLVNRAAEWPWSSHAYHRSNDTGSVRNLPVMLPQDWPEYVDKPITENELERLRRSVNRQTPFGSPGWQGTIIEALGLSATINPRGRPRKWGQEK